MQNYYRINVSRNGYYLFATEQGHITTREEAEKIIDLFQHKFPVSEGYQISCIYWRSTGEHIL